MTVYSVIEPLDTDVKRGQQLLWHTKEKIIAEKMSFNDTNDEIIIDLP